MWPVDKPYYVFHDIKNLPVLIIASKDAYLYIYLCSLKYMLQLSVFLFQSYCSWNISDSDNVHKANNFLIPFSWLCVWESVMFWKR